MNGTPMEINMLVEKKYPLIKELLEKVLNLQLEAKEEIKSVSEDTSNEVWESPDASLVEELVSNDKLEKKTVSPTVAKIINTVKGKFNTARSKAVNTARPNTTVVNAVRANQGHPQKEDQGYVDSGCSRNMTGNMSLLFSDSKIN
ncbi:hypothetical protein Tco_0564783 [Tanacetum coccineum]